MGSDLLLETYLRRLRLPTVAANYRRFFSFSYEVVL